MFRGDPEVFQLTLKEGHLLSPCIIKYSMGSGALNFMQTYPSGRSWAAAPHRAYHFEMPQDFKIGDYLEVGFEWNDLKSVRILNYFERHKNKLRFRLEEERHYELTVSLEGIHWELL